MVQRSKFWTGTTVGDATDAPYDAPTEFAEVLKSVAAAGRDHWGVYGFGQAISQGGVLSGELGELNPTTGGTVSVTIASGRALSYGGWFESNIGEVFPIATPSGATRIDRIVVRKDWVAQTIRLVYLIGTPGSGIAASMTQVVGDKYDIPIVEVSITTGGAITIADRRTFLPLIINPACLLYYSASQSIPTATPTAVIWNSEIYNTNGTEFFNAAVNQSRLYIPRTGLYHIWANLMIHAQPPYQVQVRSVDMYVQPFSGGSPLLIWNEVRDYDLNDQPTFFSPHFEQVFNKGDYLYIMVTQNNSNSVPLTSSGLAQPLTYRYPQFGARWLQHAIPGLS